MKSGKLEEEIARKKLGNFKYYKNKYEALFNSAKSNDERRYVRKSIFENELLSDISKNEIWEYLSSKILMKNIKKQICTKNHIRK